MSRRRWSRYYQKATVETIRYQASMGFINILRAMLMRIHRLVHSMPGLNSPVQHAEKSVEHPVTVSADAVVFVLVCYPQFDSVDV